MVSSAYGAYLCTKHIPKDSVKSLFRPAWKVIKVYLNDMIIYSASIEQQV